MPGGADGKPYLIVGAAILLILLMLYVRSRLNKRKPEVPAVLIGNGQTIGARNEQDDYFASTTTTIGTLAVLADGISGLANGRMCSTLAVSTFLKNFLNVEHVRHIPYFLSETARRVNSEIVEQLRGAQGGTTLVAGILNGDHLYWGAVGDSVILIYRQGEFLPVNPKHTYENVLEQKYLSGEITKDEMEDNPKKRQLVNYLGYEQFQNMEISETPFRLKPGDKIIFCSDGVYNTLTEVEMEQILTGSGSPEESAQGMIDAIEAKGLHKQDNATVIILEKG
ncbi:protein phosphatase [Paenibacillus chitinolyticus]|uniref:PP2C family protein-serine/threonine phosphatase n=1 Tax=Paenibacillus chitinolyticus TaxID=79263 RepID=UPI0026E4F9DB|nr:protein phosphatase 2C domain-containing protein [Paenibacillus chitinolyticus]GKS12205.1 protein phosphatase [Paenibacillus chitinolyticus]